MEWFERSASVPAGGRGSGGGGCYHLSFRSGSRGGGACAGAAHAYVTRTDEYDDADRDAAVYLDPGDHIALSRAFAEALTADERLPYTLAIHAAYNAPLTRATTTFTPDG